MYDKPSVIAQVHLSPAAFSQFRSAPNKAIIFPDTLPWLETKTWQGKDADLPSKLIIEKSGFAEKNYCENEQEEFSLQEYDPQSKSFNLFWFDHNINYLELVAFLNSFRQIANYKDSDNIDFLVIGFEGWQIDDTELILKLERGCSSIECGESGATENILDKAAQLSEQMMDRLSMT